MACGPPPLTWDSAGAPRRSPHSNRGGSTFGIPCDEDGFKETRGYLVRTCWQVSTIKTVRSSVSPVAQSALAKGTPPEAVSDAIEVRSSFRRLFDVWDRDTFIHSCPDEIYGHWAYAQILRLGEPAIPYMLGEMQRGRSKLVMALDSITGESPVQVSKPTTEDVTAAWMDWGEAKGYVPTIA